MFNSPVLDVAIGLVFLFLLYSLLATSVKETIATVFAFRARMLKTAITEMMLSCKDKETAKSRWASIFKGIGEFFQQTLYIITGNLSKRKNNLGTYFYDHPVIKSYGASRVFPNPSYIPADDFSTIVTDILRKDFTDKLDDIARHKLTVATNIMTLLDVKNELQSAPDIIKIKELLDYYGWYFTIMKKPPALFAIDKETWYMLQLHLKNSLYNADAFTKQLETWFNQTMDRVSGWYKRQVQVILFFIGMAIAITFNVDIIEIANKLTTDKDARDKIVQLAIKEADQYKDDPRVKTPVKKQGDTTVIASDSLLFLQYQQNLASIRKNLQGGLDTANNLLAIGWGDFGKKTDSVETIKRCEAQYNKILDSVVAERKTTRKNATPADSAVALSRLYNKHWMIKVGYAVKSTHGKKLLGFTILAFAVCLGAPFWFDLLNKLIKLRSSGKKEDGNSTDKHEKAAAAIAQQPLAIHVNTQTGTEAVG